MDEQRDPGDRPVGGLSTEALTDGERRRVLVAGFGPSALFAVVLLVLLALGRASVADLVVGTVLYGGLIGLAAAVVVHERALSRHCPRCGAVSARAAPRCTVCDYDLVARPVFMCEQRHEAAHEPGLCSCGRRLVERPPVPGMGRSVRRTLWAGLWLFAFLVGSYVLIVGTA